MSQFTLVPSPSRSFAQVVSLLTTFVLAILLGQRVYATTSTSVPQSFTLDGQLLQVGTQNPLLDPAAKLTLDILDPSKTCILYEEQQTVNTSSTNGYFNIQVGSATGAAQRTASDPGNSMAQVYQNLTAITGNSAPGQTCTGGTYTPTMGDTRYFRITVTPSATGVADTLSPDTILSSVPTAVEAQTADTLQGLSPSQLLQVNTSGGAQLTQANLNSLFTGSSYTNLQSVSSGNFTPQSSTGATDLPNYTTASPPTSPTSGSVWFDSTAKLIKFYDGTTTQTLPTSTSTAPSGAAGAVQLSGGSNFSSDATNFYWDSTNHELGVDTNTPQAALDVNGGVRMGMTSASCTSTNKGTVRYNTTTNILEFCNGTAWNTVQAAACSSATPAAFSFTNLANQSLSTLVTSNIVQITGINCLVPTSISGVGSPEYRICSDSACTTVLQSWTTGPSSIQNGDYVELEQTTNAAGGVTNNATMIIGGGGSVWGATTTGTCSYGATETAAIGTRCADGTIYAGVSPDGNNPMYTTPCDYGQTWNGTACTGSAVGLSWNNGSTSYTTTNVTSGVTGATNTSDLNALTGNADYPYIAAEDCAGLNSGSGTDGHTDWYLPAASELNVLYNNNGVIGNFNTSGSWYWSSTEYNVNNADHQKFSTGNQNGYYKNYSFLVRCVRKY